MTKAEIAAFCARNKEKLSRPFPARPITDADRKRFAELKARYEEAQK
jgi:hypothetical protein